ncbi:ribosome hibernation-promoting factor, HPF/YfiA family [Oceanomicrobium pacificus]|uniref:Ribosome hibernation promoting factor n=1 Tax=Oceanomicrobium pacificus TaxID=2692916 RepID=A0A6B0TSA2_9RHOB|nr:ribosome-associated translation inhibitor RaiA [Oceanomicrobium pacificus]MXU64685.1 ribosome-associated translation inhibitor RaiA [Oceanomicrobium pacificus]
MRIQVNGKQIDVGDALRTHVEDRLTEVVGKYAERPVEAVVTFSKDRHEFICDASVHLSTGMSAQAKSAANEVYDSFEGALDRMEKQLRRYKRRLKDHHRSRPDPIEAMNAAAYVLAGTSHEEESQEPESLQPIIIAETKTQVQSLSVGEAVMQMELAGAPMLVFRNESSGNVNVVYQRDDGNIGWIDPNNS